MTRSISVFGVVLGFMMLTTSLFSQDEQHSSQALKIDGGNKFSIIKTQPQNCSGFFMVDPQAPVPYEDVISGSRNYTIMNNKGSAVSFSSEVIKKEVYYDPITGYDIFPNDWGKTSTGLIPDGQSVLKDVVFFPRQERSFLQVEDAYDEDDATGEVVDEYDGDELSSYYTSLELAGFFYVLERNIELEKWFFYHSVPHVLTSEGNWLVPFGGPYNSLLFRAILHNHFGICNLDDRD